MKILLIGDASNYHATLASALAQKGHDVTVASAGSGWMATRRNVDLSRRDGKLGGALLQLRLDTVLRSKLRGYDVVQLCDTSFVSLRPERQLALARRLKRDNGRLVFCAVGDNPFYVDNLTGGNPLLAYSEWQSPWGRSVESNAARWTTPLMLDYARRLLEMCDGVTTALYEYQSVMSHVVDGAMPVDYVGIPVDDDLICKDACRVEAPSADKPITILYAAHCGREALKGADILMAMLRRLQADRPGEVRVVVPENVPYAEFVKLLDDVDIVSDQLYSYTPATTALLAMARGAVAITGGEADYLKFIGHDMNVVSPIFNPDPRDIDGTYRRLLSLIDNRRLLRAMQAAAPEFVRRHNAASIVADRALAAWSARR